MKVSIVGPGALGCLFAARLAHAGVEVVLVDHSPERADFLSKNGIRLQQIDGGEINAYPALAMGIPKDCDLIILTVKSHHIHSIDFSEISVPVLTLQNGLTAVEILCSKIDNSHILAGITTEAATLVKDGYAIHQTSSGKIIIGPWTSCSPQIAQEIFLHAGFNVSITDAPGRMIWEKTIISAGILPITALLNIPNGLVLKINEVRHLMRDLVVEATKVASMEGYRFPYSMIEKTEEVCANTADNISSMLQDIRQGKLSENDAISGEIVRRGQLQKVPVPRTMAIWQLIKGLEQK